jgi:hypothetical protein
MMRRLITSMAVLVTAFVMAPLSLSNAAPQPTVSPTLVVHLRPVGTTGKLLPGYKVTHTRSGAKCSAGSESIGNAGYRCFAGNGVYDPCWVGTNRAYVYCLGEAWSFDVVRLHVTRGYSNGGLSSHVGTVPWGLELANGSLCGLLEGASGTVAGKRINYFCEHTKDVVVGPVDKHTKPWRVRTAISTGGGHYKLGPLTNVTKAWLGKPSRKGKA